MKREIRPAGFFAKMTGAGSWADRLAKLKAKAKAKTKPAATAKLEIDDANGETMVFPDIGDVSEIVEGVAVTATDADHVFTADGSTYTITVLDGKVTTVIEDTTEEDEDPGADQTGDFIEAVATELATNETFRTTAQASIDAANARADKMEADLVALKKLLKHKGDGTNEEGGAGAPKAVKVNGMTINLDKINLKNQ